VLVVLPAAGYAEVASRQTLVAEARAVDEGERGAVLRDDVGLDAMEAERANAWRTISATASVMKPRRANSRPIQ
jgi:hypothetical protein